MLPTFYAVYARHGLGIVQFLLYSFARFSTYSPLEELYHFRLRARTSQIQGGREAFTVADTDPLRGAASSPFSSLG